MEKRSAAIYAAGHFLVDFSCALLMYSGEHPAVQYLIYNFCAFALQMPIGLLADWYGRNRRFALIGLGLVFAALLPLPSALRVVLAGFGNAFYHVGGGRDALMRSHKMTALGIFVSPGALGIFLGGFLAGSGAFRCAALAALFVCACAVVFQCDGTADFQTPGKIRFQVAGLMFGVVLLRSLVGLTMDAPWKAGMFVALAAVAAAAGKALGGIAADRFGGRKTGAATLIASAALFCVPHWSAGILGTLLFNMTMPITLRRASDAMPGWEGFAFGLLTFALFLGFLPAYFGLSISYITGAVLSLASAGLMLLDKEG